MNIVFYNLGWMSWNVFLALLSVLLGKLALDQKTKFARFVTTIISLLFLPNTIYIATDLGHLLEQWPRVEIWARAGLILEYFIIVPIGFITFIYSMEFLEKNLTFLYKPLKNTLVMVGVNFLVAFGIVIGRVQRTNSWEVVTDPLKIVHNVVVTFSSVRLILYVLGLGFFCSLLYLGVRKKGVGERT